MTPIKYSICICNYNMADTIERALKSVVEQLDDTYEVILLDDGSSDNSLEIVKKMEKKYPILRSIYKKRDPNRKLGETRNLCIQEARGEYVILHIDSDDVWEPFIKEFVTIFHRIEKVIDRDFLLSGQQINIGKKSFLLNHGPYRNAQRAEDRDMWIRLAAIDAYIPLDHRVFKTRLKRPQKIKYFKTIHDLWYHMLFDIRSIEGIALYKYVLDCLTCLFIKYSNTFSFKIKIFRTLFAIPALVVGKILKSLPRPENMKKHKEFVNYRERTRGTYELIMRRYVSEPDFSGLSNEAIIIFKSSK